MGLVDGDHDYKITYQVNSTPLDNLREFRYLRHVLTNEKTPKFLSHRIDFAYKAWSEMKTVLTDCWVRLKNRVKIAESTVRSRLTYAMQSGQMSAAEKRG